MSSVIPVDLAALVVLTNLVKKINKETRVLYPHVQLVPDQDMVRKHLRWNCAICQLEFKMAIATVQARHRQKNTAHRECKYASARTRAKLPAVSAGAGASTSAGAGTSAVASAGAGTSASTSAGTGTVISPVVE